MDKLVSVLESIVELTPAELPTEAALEAVAETTAFPIFCPFACFLGKDILTWQKEHHQRRRRNVPHHMAHPDGALHFFFPIFYIVPI